MDFVHKVYLQRAENELRLSMMVLKISDNKELQVSVFGMKEDTYYSATIAHAYYCIFYAAKAYLLLKNIKTQPPEEHKKVFEAFSGLVKTGVVDVELLKIYEKMLVKADTLLNILAVEKGKRGRFTYQRIPQANRVPAKESIDHAQFFFKNLYQLVTTEK